jgi:fermentation-respiration switch protein FrsA (DUF1100 family)
VRKYIPVVLRIFQEKPLFIVPVGQPAPDAEDVALTTPDGLTLQAFYWRTSRPRKGVILFGLEFGSNRWGAVPYCEFLREAGYDIFAFEMRGQGNSPAQSGYEPLQWVTDFEMIDFQTAVAYLKSRADRDPRGIGLFGLSKGASAGLMVAAQDEYLRCFVVDGAFAAVTTMLPYMLKFVQIYTSTPWLARRIPFWYLRIAARIAMHRIEKLRDCHYPFLEKSMPKLAPRPLFMIHGGADNYIKPEMAKALFDLALEPKEFWLVEKAKHNQCFHLANEEIETGAGVLRQAPGRGTHARGGRRAAPCARRRPGARAEVILHAPVAPA